VIHCNGIIENGWCKSCGKAEAPANEICFFDDPFWFSDKKEQPIRSRNLPSFRPPEDLSSFYQRRLKKYKIERAKFLPMNSSTRSFVFHRDKHQCLACGSLENLTLDHIIPKIAGGGGEATNLQTLCEKCNTEKGSRTRDYRLIQSCILKSI